MYNNVHEYVLSVMRLKNRRFLDVKRSLSQGYAHTHRAGEFYEYVHSLQQASLLVFPFEAPPKHPRQIFALTTQLGGGNHM